MRTALAALLIAGLAGCGTSPRGMTIVDPASRAPRVEHMSEDPRLVFEIEPIDDAAPFARHRLVVTNASIHVVEVDRASLIADLNATVVPVLVYPADGRMPGEGLIGPNERAELVAEIAPGTGLPTPGEAILRVHYRYLRLGTEEFADVPIVLAPGRSE